MDRTQFTFYESFYKAVSRIRDPQARAQAYDAICAYALYGTEPDMEAMPDCAAIAFELIKPNLDSSRRKAENGKKGGSSKQTEATGSKPEAKGKQLSNKKEKEGENKKEKEIENECYMGKPARHKYGQYSNVLLSDSDMEKLRNEFPDWEARIERLSEYMASTGKSYKSHLATIRNWARRDAGGGRQPAKPEPPRRGSWADIAEEMDREEGLA